LPSQNLSSDERLEVFQRRKASSPFHDLTENAHLQAQQVSQRHAVPASRRKLDQR